MASASNNFFHIEIDLLVLLKWGFKERRDPRSGSIWRADYPMTSIGVNVIQQGSSFDGHKSLSMHLSQAGLRAWHMRRP